MKILNLFAGIGGNRTLWGNNHEITAVENNQKMAMIYHKRFPNDKMNPFYGKHILDSISKYKQLKLL